MPGPLSPGLPEVIHLRKLTLARGGRPLVADASLQIHDGWRIGLSGANGSGKSSLLALLAGELQPEAGDCELPTAWRIARLDQEVAALPQPALEYVLDGDGELRAVQAALARAESAHDAGAIADLHARLESLDGYTAAARAATILAGLGFTQADLSRAVADFSGGWRMRLNLARVMMSRADLLLLDEPTNHLDLDAIVWFERWLGGFPGTLVLVSHDRDVLDACVTHVLHLETGTLTLYTGNYSSFEEQRAARLATQQAMFEKQQREISHLERFVARFRAKASKARQAQSRLKALDRLERIAPAHVDTPFDFEFEAPDRSPDPLLVLESASLGHDTRAVLENVDLSLRAGARIGLLGPNGAGKSTLIASLAGELPLVAGRRIEGQGLAIGYFAQHQLEQLDPEESPLWHLAQDEPDARSQDLRGYLGHFDFGGDKADAAVSTCSGGERSRLALARLVRRRPNLLLLDEPTNHLDLEMRHALTRALTAYEGSVLLVSHDRALLRTVCDEFLIVADGRVERFDGGIEDYLDWLSARRDGSRGAAVDSGLAQARAERREARADREARRQAWLRQRRPLVRELEQLESALPRLEKEKSALESRLADASFYSSASPDEQRATSRRCTEITEQLRLAEERWLELHEQIEALGEA